MYYKIDNVIVSKEEFDDRVDVFEEEEITDEDYMDLFIEEILKYTSPENIDNVIDALINIITFTKFDIIEEVNEELQNFGFEINIVDFDQ